MALLLRLRCDLSTKTILPPLQSTTRTHTPSQPTARLSQILSVCVHGTTTQRCHLACLPSHLFVSQQVHNKRSPVLRAPIASLSSFCLQAHTIRTLCVSLVSLKATSQSVSPSVMRTRERSLRSLLGNRVLVRTRQTNMYTTNFQYLYTDIPMQRSSPHDRALCTLLYYPFLMESRYFWRMEMIPFRWVIQPFTFKRIWSWRAIICSAVRGAGRWVGVAFLGG